MQHLNQNLTYQRICFKQAYGQRHLSCSTDPALYETGAPDTSSRALDHSAAIPRACDWLNVVPAQSLCLYASLGLGVSCSAAVLAGASDV